jgi:hypothetical protein
VRARASLPSIRYSWIPNLPCLLPKSARRLLQPGGLANPNDISGFSEIDLQ